MTSFISSQSPILVVNQTPSAGQVPAVGSQVGRFVGTLNVSILAALESITDAPADRDVDYCHWAWTLGVTITFSKNTLPSWMGWWELRAHVLLRNARLLWFGRGVSRPRRPVVGLTKSTFGCFCDGSKDFLKLSRLLSQIHSIDHTRNAQECLYRVNAIRATIGDTWERD